jgi:MFS family permease
LIVSHPWRGARIKGPLGKMDPTMSNIHDPEETGPEPISGSATRPNMLLRGMYASGRGSKRAATGLFRLTRNAAGAEGARESGLSRLIELHAFNAAGDAAVAISLAGTLFFASPGEARDRVALFLGLTMLPFVVVAPLLGPFLDRFSHGRRWAIGGTMAMRGLLCLWLADSIASDSLQMYPAALGCLVTSKTYGVARAATVPRLLPPGLTLVKANGRISLAGVVGAAVSGPLAAGAATIGAEWSLRYAFVIFAIATILSILLPPKVDSNVGEQPSSIFGNGQKLRLPMDTVFALRCNVGLRVLSGFLTMYMAFLLKQNPLPGWEDKTLVLMGLVIGAAGLGNTVGIALGSVARRINPKITLISALIADCLAAAMAAVFYGLLPAIALGLTAGIAQALGKLALDSTIQVQVPEQQRTSAFGRSETVLQLSWVIGGFIGIALPLIPQLGLGVLAGLIAGWTTFVLVKRPTQQDSHAIEGGTR